MQECRICTVLEWPAGHSPDFYYYYSAAILISNKINPSSSGRTNSEWMANFAFASVCVPIWLLLFLKFHFAATLCVIYSYDLRPAHNEAADIYWAIFFCY